MPAQYGLGADAPKRGLRWLYLPFMLLMGVGSMALETQRIAAFFNYSPALGEPWGMAGGILWYAPWSVFTWQELFVSADPYGFMEQVVTQSQALFLVPQFAVVALWLAFMNKVKGNANLRGSARWATEAEIRLMGYVCEVATLSTPKPGRVLRRVAAEQAENRVFRRSDTSPDGKGVYIGGYARELAGTTLLWAKLLGRPVEQLLYLRHNGPEHLLVFAPTRSGKGVGLILPTLLTWGGQTVADGRSGILSGSSCCRQTGLAAHPGCAGLSGIGKPPRAARALYHVCAPTGCQHGA